MQIAPKEICFRIESVKKYHAHKNILRLNDIHSYNSGPIGLIINFYSSEHQLIFVIEMRSVKFKYKLVRCYPAKS